MAVTGISNLTNGNKPSAAQWNALLTKPGIGFWVPSGVGALTVSSPTTYSNKFYEASTVTISDTLTVDNANFIVIKARDSITVSGTITGVDAVAGAAAGAGGSGVGSQDGAAGTAGGGFLINAGDGGDGGDGGNGGNGGTGGNGDASHSWSTEVDEWLQARNLPAIGYMIDERKDLGHEGGGGAGGGQTETGVAGGNGGAGGTGACTIILIAPTIDLSSGTLNASGGDASNASNRANGSDYGSGGRKKAVPSLFRS